MNGVTWPFPDCLAASAKREQELLAAAVKHGGSDEQLGIGTG